MATQTIVAYVVTLLCVYFSITSAPIALLGGIIGRGLGNILIGGLLGAVLTWLGIAWLWKVFEGKPVPILVLAVTFLFLLSHSAIKKDELTQASQWMIAAEQWGIIIVGVIMLLSTESIRWY